MKPIHSPALGLEIVVIISKGKSFGQACLTKRIKKLPMFLEDLK